MRLVTDGRGGGRAARANSSFTKLRHDSIHRRRCRSRADRLVHDIVIYLGDKSYTCVVRQMRGTARAGMATPARECGRQSCSGAVCGRHFGNFFLMVEYTCWRVVSLAHVALHSIASAVHTAHPTLPSE